MIASTTDSTHIEGGNAKSSVSNPDIRPHAHPVFESFFRWQHQLAQEVLFNGFNLVDTMPYWVEKSWCNVHLNGGYTKAHAHGMSALSIVAYIDLPENSGYLEVKDPHYDLKNIHKRNNTDTDEDEWAVIPAVTGDVIFFPGWLQHRTQPNSSDKERWIVSTNYVNHRYMNFDQLGQ
jgi:uncharacterized protein (TIGR02466 family)